LRWGACGGSPVGERESGVSIRQRSGIFALRARAARGDARILITARRGFPRDKGLRMNSMETGLRHRLRRAVRQIATQHEHLRSAHQAVADAAAAGDMGELAASVDRLSGAVEAHFSLEESVFFPAIHGLHPQSVSELEALMDDHHTYRADLDRLRHALANQLLGEFVEGYRAFAKATGEHEVREERLLASLSHLFDGAD
jgi:hypothetical protein